MIADWSARADSYLANRAMIREDIKSGVDAWTVAHCIGATREAYGADRDILDAHIQTALARVFPQAVFKDAKRY